MTALIFINGDNEYPIKVEGDDFKKLGRSVASYMSETNFKTFKIEIKNEEIKEEKENGKS